MSKQGSISRNKIPIGKIVYVLVVLLLVAFGVFFFVRYQQLSDKYAAATMSKEDQIKKVVAEVQKFYNIPNFDTEQPSVPGVDGTAIYTILKEDLDSIKNTNKFFADAQADDKLVAYKNANIAVLYRPSEKRIIKTGSYADAALIKVQVGIVANEEVAKSLESKLKAKYPNIAVSVDSPKTTVVAKGIVVDVNGKEQAAAKQLADTLGYTIGPLPAGESAPKDATFIVVAPNAPIQ